MKVVFMTKQGWLILLASCVFIIGNFVLLYRFVSKTSASLGEDARLKELSDRYLDNVVKKGRLKGLANAVQELRKRPGKSTTISNESIDELTLPKDEKKESLSIVSQHVQENHEGGIDTNSKSSAIKQTPDHKQPIMSFKKDIVSPSTEAIKEIVAPILVIACNRPTAVKRCLDLLLQHRPSAKQFPIIVSQDCGHQETADVIASYGSKITHIKQPDLSEVQGAQHHMMGYYKISRHYKWALGQVFDSMGHDNVIIVEDDLDIAPDFYEYFTATKPLLDKDPSLWCISAWNDNGKEGMVERNDILYRTDFFPGLGWLMTKTLWNELKPKWPLGFWDDWMREPAQRKDRACIRPEIPRTKTFGRIGVSHGQFFDQHLKYIKLNDKFHPFTKTDLSYLLKDNYDKNFVGRVRALPLATVGQLIGKNVFVPEVQVHYASERDFQNVGKSLGAMTDFKAGIPRMSYQGIVTIMYGGKIVHLVPSG